jgi:sodium-coupled neutral amino acid transporter 9
MKFAIICATFYVFNLNLNLFRFTGTVSIVYLIIFILIKSASWGINMDQNEWKTSWVIRSTFPALTGILAMSFFIHNIIINIMNNNRNQEKNVSCSKFQFFLWNILRKLKTGTFCFQGRDLTIAYVLVTLTYVIIGIAFFICFPLPKSCIEDVSMQYWKQWSLTKIIIRCFLY